MPIITPEAMALEDVTSFALLPLSTAAVSAAGAAPLSPAASAGTESARIIMSSAIRAASFFIVFMADYLFLHAAVPLRVFFVFFALGAFSCFSVDSP